MTPHRSRFRFSLRFLLFCTFAAALVFAWYAWRLSEGRRHERIAAKLREAGVDVGFSLQLLFGAPVTSKSSLPTFAERYGFSVAMRRISSMSIDSGTDVSAALTLLNEIRNIDALTFHMSGLSESQIAAVLSKVNVDKLYLYREFLPTTRIHWLNHDGLRMLDVWRTPFSNPAIDDLPQSLEYFCAIETQINDDGLPSFVRLVNLKVLDLIRTPTSEDAVNTLRQRMPWCVIAHSPVQEP